MIIIVWFWLIFVGYVLREGISLWCVAMILIALRFIDEAENMEEKR